MTQPAATTAPIADLSYRGYDGPLETRTFRWWTVALATIRLSYRKVWFWIWSVLSSLGYLFTLIGLFLMAQFGQQMGAGDALKNTQWARQFVQPLPWSIFFLVAVTMVVGAGTIANDNRANALLVYLSKPVTKLDYLVGKWFGTFVMLFAVAFLPALILYLYCLLSFRTEGFFTGDRLLLGRVLLVTGIAAALHTSLMMGFSAWSKSSLMAGGLYAGFYFLGVVLAPIMSYIIGRNDWDGRAAVTTRCFALPGIVEGLSWHIFRLHPVQAGRGGFFGGGGEELPQPLLWPVLVWAAALVIVALVLAQVRIRAVEVVRG
jgi:ABC-2 type transport system permease protein